MPTSRYIQWAEKISVTGSTKVDRTSILERCMSQFRDYPQYKEDMRYLRICLKYADIHKTPQEVFEFMESWGIGVLNPKFYTAWACVLENAGKLEDASVIFERGRGKMRTEEEVTELMTMKEHFRARAAQNIMTGKTAAIASTESNADSEQHSRSRRALGDVRSTKRGKVAHNRAPVASCGGLAHGVSKPNSRDNNNNAGGISIFNDEGESGSTVSARAGAPTTSMSFPAEALTSKENIKKAGQWNKGGIGTKAKPIARHGFNVFTEDTADPQVGQPYLSPL